ncbi:MAG TPA: acyl carrier protein [Candidatus Omnitrophota bacterium]|nr:acyl carrier protein [Candidatus Omnitrophota bacterium]HRZ15297.1 acyl carrier protein [Candidatus Omnitrophota bacterium]
MDKSRILELINGIFRDCFDDAALVIVRETSAKDIGDWDSLANVNLVIAMEKEFKVKFTLSELQDLRNVGDMVDLIERKKNA